MTVGRNVWIIIIVLEYTYYEFTNLVIDKLEIKLLRTQFSVNWDDQ